MSRLKIFEILKVFYKCTKMKFKNLAPDDTTHTAEPSNWMLIEPQPGGAKSCNGKFSTQNVLDGLF